MVYRGKPSAGCENCRKAKKRCTLEHPACTRCVKLKKECVGYRDTTQLQIQDETQSVLDKVEKRKTAQNATSIPSQIVAKDQKTMPIWHIHNFNTMPPPTTKPSSSTPSTLHLSSISPTSSSSTSTLDTASYYPPHTATTNERTVTILRNPKAQQLYTVPEMEVLSTNVYGESAYAVNFHLSTVFTLIQWATRVPQTLSPLPDDVAINMFLNHCAGDPSWSYFHQSEFVLGKDTCLDLAIKACGMAALHNVRRIPSGREWSRSMYTKAIGLLNSALKDPKQSRHDDSLVAVTMLSFYENLTCDSMQSITSWKAHIQGATQLLKLRGKAQFNTMVGRQLYRELRAQILVSCIWDDRKPPDFLMDWQEELQRKSTTLVFIGPTDHLMDICFEYATMRADSEAGHLSNHEALDIANRIDESLRQWAIDALDQDDRWKYQEVKVKPSPQVWNGMVHNFACLPIPTVWTMYRSVRILVSRSHELLARSVAQSEEERQARIAYFRGIRRQMTDEICAAVPCLLGHAEPAFNSPCVLVSAYNGIWPIFFAATCAFERFGLDMWEPGNTSVPLSAQSTMNATYFSSAAAQGAWLLGRLDYISSVIGVKWADGIARSLREGIKVHKAKALAYRATLTPGSSAEHEYLSVAGEIVKGVMGWQQQLSGTT